MATLCCSAGSWESQELITGTTRAKASPAESRLTRRSARRREAIRSQQLALTQPSFITLPAAPLYLLDAECYLLPYGCPPAFHFGRKSEFTSHSMANKSDAIAVSMCLKSK